MALCFATANKSQVGLTLRQKMKNSIMWQDFIGYQLSSHLNCNAPKMNVMQVVSNDLFMRS